MKNTNKNKIPRNFIFYLKIFIKLKMSRAQPNYFPNRIQKGLFTGMQVETSVQTLQQNQPSQSSVSDFPSDIEGEEQKVEVQQSHQVPQYYQHKSMFQIRHQK